MVYFRKFTHTKKSSNAIMRPRVFPHTIISKFCKDEELEPIGLGRIFDRGGANCKSHHQKFLDRETFYGTKILQNGRSQVIAWVGSLPGFC